MKTTPRMRRVNESVREALADILESELSDPRLELVTVTDVEVAPDLRHATVFVTAHVTLGTSLGTRPSTSRSKSSTISGRR